MYNIPLLNILNIELLCDTVFYYRYLCSFQRFANQQNQKCSVDIFARFLVHIGRSFSNVYTQQ